MSQDIKELVAVSSPKRLLLAIALMLGAALLATEAQASDMTCAGSAPQAGETLKGPVLYVAGAGRLCIALDAQPSRWVEVQAEDAALIQASTGQDPRQSMMAAAFGRDAVCVVTDTSGEVPVARCAIEGQSLTERLRSPDVIKTAAAWR